MKNIFKKIVTVSLAWEARMVIRKYKPTIIAITGSVGKTSTKDATYHLLAHAGIFVRKSEKSFNSEVGVPLTILGLQNGWNNPFLWLRNIGSGLGSIFSKTYPKCLVLEVGADHPGDIEWLTKWLKPDIAVITAVSKIPVHVEFFPSPEAVLKEKLALARGVRLGGALVLPANDNAVLAVRSEIPQSSVFTFGFDATADVSAMLPEIVYEMGKPVGMSFTLQNKSQNARVSIRGVIGTQHINSIIAASAGALAYGVDFPSVNFASITEAISSYRPPRGRMNILEGVGGSVLIDDTYNASPDAVREALNIFGEIKSADSTKLFRKIAVLGDMMELGKFSAEEHRKVGKLVVPVIGEDGLLVTIGIRARDIREGAIMAGMPRKQIYDFETSSAAGEWFRNIKVKEGDIILIKGSQSPRLERVTYALLADQSRSADLLVRQEPAWLAKN